jgi:HEAT repeat protein
MRPAGRALVTLPILASLAFAQPEHAVDSTEAVRQLADRLENGSLQERREAAWDLADYGAVAVPAIAVLARATADRDPQVSNGALQALGRIGPGAEIALSEVYEQLRERDSQRRYRAAFAFGHIAKADNPLILEGLRDSSPQLRAATIEVVGWMGDSAAPLVAEIVQLLDDDSAEVSSAATGTLRKLGPIAVPTLCQSLQADDADVLQRTARTLALMGPAAAAANPRLKELCLSEVAAVRAAALNALGKTALDDAEARELVYRALGDDDMNVVIAAITSVIAFGPRAASAVPLLIDKVDGPPEIADLTAIALGRLGNATLPHTIQLLNRLTPANQLAIVNTVSRLGPAAVPPVLQAAADAHVTVPQAVQIIGQMGPRAETVLLPALASERETDRAVAAGALGHVRRLADTTEKLIPLLNDLSGKVRTAAAEGLAELGPMARAARPNLQSILQDSDASVRGASLTALVALGSPADEITPALLVGLRDTQADVRRQAATALGNLDKISPEAIGALADALTDVDALVRRQVAGALGTSESAAQAAAVALSSALQDADTDVALASAQALGKIESLDEPTARALLHLLDHPSDNVRSAAISALASGGDVARRDQHRIDAFRTDGSAEIRAAAIRTIASLATDDQQRLAGLTAGLDDPDWTVRRLVAQRIGDLGDRGAPAVPRLLELMTNPQDSEAATAALRRIDAAPAEAIPMLLEILNDRNSNRRIRFYALHLLRKTGTAAQSALPALRELRDQAEGRVRESFDRAIKEIEQ